MVLDSFLDAVLGFLLLWNPLIAVLVLSLVISLVITLVYKKFTNQSLLKDLKDEMKRLQELSKTLRENPSELMAVQKKVMDLNFKYMIHGFRATLITFIPVILLFGWMNAHFTSSMLQPGEQFSFIVDLPKPSPVTLLPPQGLQLLGSSSGENVTPAIFSLKGDSDGVYDVGIVVGGKAYSKEAVIGLPKQSRTSTLSIRDGVVSSLTVGYKKLILIDLGWLRLGWLGTYLISSIIFSIVLRKLLKVY